MVSISSQGVGAQQANTSTLVDQYGQIKVYETPEGKYFLNNAPNIYYSQDPFKQQAGEPIVPVASASEKTNEELMAR